MITGLNGVLQGQYVAMSGSRMSAGRSDSASAVSAGGDGDRVSLSSSPQLQDVRGKDGMLKLGAMALGDRVIESWQQQGLELSEEALLSAAKAFQEGFSALQRESGGAPAGRSLALNSHQIVMGAQPVPDWFEEAYATTLAAMDDPQMQASFKEGDLYHIRDARPEPSPAILRYQQNASQL